MRLRAGKAKPKIAGAYVLNVAIYAWNLRSFLLGGVHSTPGWTGRPWVSTARLLSRVHFRPGTSTDGSGVVGVHGWPETTRWLTVEKRERLFDFAGDGDPLTTNLTIRMMTTMMMIMSTVGVGLALA